MTIYELQHFRGKFNSIINFVKIFDYVDPNSASNGPSKIIEEAKFGKHDSNEKIYDCITRDVLNESFNSSAKFYQLKKPEIKLEGFKSITNKAN